MLDSLLALPAHAHYMGDLSRLSSVEAQEVKEGPVGMKVKMSREQKETRNKLLRLSLKISVMLMSVTEGDD